MWGKPLKGLLTAHPIGSGKGRIEKRYSEYPQINELSELLEMKEEKG